MTRLVNGKTHNWHIGSIAPLPTPDTLKAEHPLSEEAWEAIYGARIGITKILSGEDQRLLAVVGPCSIHSTTEALEYAKRLASLAKELKDTLLIAMRVCCDKPRTKKSWTGFFDDPRMDGSCDIAYGWREGRKLMVEITELGLPIAVEFLDEDNFQGIDDLVSYVWIGARSVQSQRLRKVASGISTAIGFKNHNLGSADAAFDAIEFARHSNVFVASNNSGVRSRFSTTGNPWGHLIHRGTEKGPNFDAASIELSAKELKKRGLIDRVVIDASHANSGKDHKKQAGVISEVVRQVTSGSRNVAGFMYESYLEGGQQPIPLDLSDLKPNISVTDGCDGWERTEQVLREVSAMLAGAKPKS
jgi:3-deoxy-7-phosphoheptulonate synthase